MNRQEAMDLIERIQKDAVAQCFQGNLTYEQSVFQTIMNSIDNAQELKSCPFCGGVAALYEGHEFGFETFVWCRKCQARGQKFIKVFEITTIDAINMATEAWNKRI